MSMDRSFVALNRKATERMRTLASRLSDEQLLTPVGEHWTVAIVYAHLAFWERRVQATLDLTKREGKLVPVDLDVIINDLSLPLWAAIPPREAVRMGLEEAEALDKRLEGYPPALLEQVFEYNERWVMRALHRNSHLDEAEAALKA